MYPEYTRANPLDLQRAIEHALEQPPEDTPTGHMERKALKQFARDLDLHCQQVRPDHEP